MIGDVISMKMYAVRIGSRFLVPAGRLERDAIGMGLLEAVALLERRGDEAATLVPIQENTPGQKFRTALTLIIGEAVPKEEPVAVPGEEER